MSGTKEYVVALHAGIDYNQFWTEIENPTSGLPHIPDRAVSIVNNLDGFERMCHYALTDDEADRVRADVRVEGINIPLEHRTDIIFARAATQTGNFTKPSSLSDDYVNWGLIRHSNPTNVYQGGTTTSLTYTYTADGTGVDIVIVDSGIQANHPEFYFAGNTTTRVNTSWNWGGVVTNTTTFYTDYGGHGTHCAGVAAGKTYGWAKNSSIYSIKFNGLEGPGDPGTGLTLTQTVQSLLSWHNNKASSKPTVVNISVGAYYTANANPSYYTVANVSYRGTLHNSPGWNNTSYGIVNFYQGSLIPAPVLSEAPYSAYFDQLLAANIVICKSAGNDGLKVDTSGGNDYNNYMWVTNNSTGVSANLLYMRGTGITSSAIVVGALSKTPQSIDKDKKAYFSNSGPGVDIYAAGEDIVSATSNTNSYSGITTTSGFKRLTASGTSMATPQIAGIIALYLQKNPNVSPAQVKTWLLNSATNTIYSTGLSDDYSSSVSIFGGNAKVAYENVVIQTTASSGTSLDLISAITTSGATNRITVPAGLKMPVTAYIWGAGGGGGGKDANDVGGYGSGGAGYKVTFNVEEGDIIDIALGTAGLPGASSASSAAGGAGGSGYVDGSGNRFGGGRGGNAGSSGSSGGGGGGGGATVIAINGTVVAVAGGGAGGGGAGNRGTTTGDSAGNTPTIVGTNTTGQNGTNKSGDGGGAGGGGGGRYGGSTLGLRDGDSGALAGTPGASWRNTNLTLSGTETRAAGVAPASLDRFSVGPANAQGGARAGAGTNGYAVLIFSRYSLPYLKANDEWQALHQMYVKTGGDWKSVNTVYVKQKGEWKTLIQGSQLASTVLSPGVNYGAGGTRS